MSANIKCISHSVIDIIAVICAPMNFLSSKASTASRREKRSRTGFRLPDCHRKPPPSNRQMSGRSYSPNLRQEPRTQTSPFRRPSSRLPPCCTFPATLCRPQNRLSQFPSSLSPPSQTRQSSDMQSHIRHSLKSSFCQVQSYHRTFRK